MDIQRASVLDDLAKQSEPPLALMTRPPGDPMTRDRIGGQMWAGMLQRFRQSLSPAEQKAWDNPPPDFQNKHEHMCLLHKFDNFALKQAAEFGWRVLMSYEFLQRISEWEKHHPKLLDRLGAELATRSRVLRGEKSAPLPDDIEKFADDVIAELRSLLRRQRDEFGSRAASPTCSRIAAWMKVEIESHPNEFPMLSAEIAQLCMWVERLPEWNRKMAQTLTQGDLQAGSFFYQWLGNCSNRSPRDVQNEISRRRAALKRQQLVPAARLAR